MSFADLIGDVDREVIAAFGDSEDGEPVPVTYTPDGGVGVPVTGIFDEQYELVKGSPEAGVSAMTAPGLFVRFDDLPEDPMDEDSDPTVTIRSVDYRVIECVPAGQGSIVLVLRRKA